MKLLADAAKQKANHTIDGVLRTARVFIADPSNTLSESALLFAILVRGVFGSAPLLRVLMLDDTGLAQSLTPPVLAAMVTAGPNLASIAALKSF